MTAVLRYLLRKFYLLCAIALIALAVLVQAGRSLSPLVNDYREDVADSLSRELNARVSLSAVTAEWNGLKPVLEVRDLHVVSHSNAPILAFARARLRLDLLRSLWNWQLVWGSVTVQDTALEFEQTAEGFWRIPGLPDSSQKTPQAAQLDVLADMLLLASKIEFQRTHLLFRFASGHEIALSSPSLLLENQDSFHRLSLAVDIAERQRAASLIIEGEGDPRDRERFRARAFLALNEFPTSEPFAAATALLLRNVSPTQLRSEGALNARLWFNTREGNNGYDITGQLDLQTLLVPLFEQSYRLDSFSTGINGHWLHSGNWQLALPGISAGLQDTLIDNVNLAVSGDGARKPLQIQMDRLQLSAWAAVLDQSGILNQGPLQDIVSRLQPGGQLRNLRATLPVDDPAGWQLEAYAEQLSVNALGGIPALTGVDGYIKVGQTGGFINLDSRNGFSMHFNPVYREAMHYQSVNGQIAWHLLPEKNKIYINSGAIHFRSEAEEATGYLWLNLPWRPKTGDVDLFLQIGARNLKAGLYSKYLPALVPKSLTDWLAESIGENNSGMVSKAGFVYRGTLNTPNHMARSHQLYLDIDDADLAYHSDWPDLSNLSGRFLLDDSNIDASVTGARLYDSKVLAARVATHPNPAGKGALLTIQGEVEGGVGDGLRVLRESQLRQYIGSALDSWKLSGALLADIDLAIPLVQGAGGAAQYIDIGLDVSSAEIGDLQLSLQDVTGHISYHHETGFSSRNLRGVLFGESVQARLSSQREPDTDPKTLIELTGTVPAESLALWSKRPELLFLEGTVPYQTTIELIHGRNSQGGETVAAGPLSNSSLAKVTVVSDLAKVALNLPAPYGKSAKTKRALAVEFEIREQTTAIYLDYRHKDALLGQAQFLLQRYGNHLLNANVALGEQARLSDQPEFLLSGYLPAFALDEWREVQRRYEEFGKRVQSRGTPAALAGADSSAPELTAGLPLYVDVVLGSHKLGPLLLKDLKLNARQDDQAWHLQFANPMLVGSLQLPIDKSLPLLIAIEELHLNRALLGDKDGESPVEEEFAAVINEEAAGFNPRNLPRADVTVDALYFDGINYGNWSLQMHPDRQGVRFENIRGNVHGLTVGGIQSRQRESGAPASALNQHGAQIYWVRDEQGERTRFIGSLTAGDIAAVLRAWQKPDIVESAGASYQVDMTWPGAPGELALVNLQGNIDLLLQEGRFKRNAGAGDGILRLFALLNFDSIARRLRLDFSDLYKGGLTYDQVQGKIRFDHGKIYFVEPLQVESPSSRLQMAGSIDLRDETIDTRLVAALPVAGNLTFLAAFATGLPAAAGIYLVSKIFRKQVNQATSVSYSITGSWDNPRMKFDRLFESEESLRSSVNQQTGDEVQPPPTGGEDLLPADDTTKP